MGRSYRADTARWWQVLSDGQVASIVAVVVIGIWIQRPLPVVAVAAGIAFLPGWRRVAVVAAIGGLAGVAASSAAWDGVRPDRLGPYVGWACLMTDPAPRSAAVVAVFEIEGERFETWARGSPRRRLTERLAGECARIEGVRRELEGTTARRAAVRHVVGGLSLESVGDWAQGSPIARASNRVRRLFSIGAEKLPSPDDALFAGLVIGDDRHEPPEMIEQFRASGLSHLTAVSGSNVAFVLAAAAPLLRRMRPIARWLVTVALIAWFVALTRFEPSILRAGVMAGIASTGYLLGRERPPRRVLVLAVGLLVLADPMLVWSVGFWLSASATAGVAILSAPLAKVIPGPSWFALPLAVTLGAQLAVAPVSLLVFGSLPLVSIPANLLAVPVAGFVMLYGLPAGLLAGALSGASWLGPWAPVLASIVQFPSAVGTRWVATVAAVAARLEPDQRVAGCGWALLLAWFGARALRLWRRPKVAGDDPAARSVDPVELGVPWLTDGAAPDHRR